MRDGVLTRYVLESDGPRCFYELSPGSILAFPGTMGPFPRSQNVPRNKVGVPGNIRPIPRNAKRLPRSQNAPRNNMAIPRKINRQRYVKSVIIFLLKIELTVNVKLEAISSSKRLAIYHYFYFLRSVPCWAETAIHDVVAAPNHRICEN